MTHSYILPRTHKLVSGDSPAGVDLPLCGADRRARPRHSTGTTSGTSEADEPTARGHTSRSEGEPPVGIEPTTCSLREQSSPKQATIRARCRGTGGTLGRP